jgi:hypothetical protein
MTNQIHSWPSRWGVNEYRAIGFTLSCTNVFWKEILFPLVAQEKLHQKSRNIITIPKLFNTIVIKRLFLHCLFSGCMVNI